MQLLNAEQSVNPPLLSIFILSAAALAYEVLLIRLFSIIHWHHFAFMVISIALLGYGASGSFITVLRPRLLKHYDSVFIGNILLFGVSSISCFMLVQLLPFNALEILWDSAQWKRLLLSYLLLTLPFFFVANAIALSMIRYHKKIALIYAIDLIGAGLGAVAVMLLLQLITADSVLRVLAVVGLFGGFFALKNLNAHQQKIGLSLLILSLIAIFLIPQKWLELKISEYKGLAQTLMIKESTLILSRSSPLSQIDIVKSPFIPFRHAPGLSLQSPAGPPEQLAVFTDGDEMTTIDHVKARESLLYTDFMTSALPYHVHPSAHSALILAFASGTQILQADYHAIQKITAVEADKQLSKLLTGQFADYAGWDKLKSKVTLHHSTARGYATTDNNFDLVIMGPSAASGGASAGVHALSTSYTFTLEALQTYLKLLNPDGFISLTEWTSNPPRGSLKLFATAVAAMKNNGIKHPQHNIAWIRSWNTTTLLLKNTALTTSEIQRMRKFSEERSFDLAWLPDISPNEANRFQLLQKPVFYLAANSMLDSSTLNQRTTNWGHQYQYDIQPATDNRPYFNNYFKWTSLPEFLSLPGQAGKSMLGVGYPTLLFTLVQAIVATFILILLPLLSIRQEKNRTVQTRRHIIAYFISIGLAFLFIELAFIQKFTLILGQPLYAVAVSLCAFLIFSGLGSLFIQQRLQQATRSTIPGLFKHSVLAIGIITVIYILLLPLLGEVVMTLPEITRIVSAFLLAAPLAFVMGMPFPLGLAAVQQSQPGLLPWAWGINGCASVLSAILAIILAIEIGFNGVMLCAVILYVIAWRNGLIIVNSEGSVASLPQFGYDSSI